jgi:hypothetical protein
MATCQRCQTIDKTGAQLCPRCGIPLQLADRGQPAVPPLLIVIGVLGLLAVLFFVALGLLLHRVRAPPPQTGPAARADATPARPLTPPEQRAQLAAEYEALLKAAMPHLNYIEVQTQKGKGGYTLWGYHEFFTEYTFSAGSDGPAVQEWIRANSAALRDAGIVRVGVHGRGAYASSTWFAVGSGQ